MSRPVKKVVLDVSSSFPENNYAQPSYNRGGRGGGRGRGRGGGRGSGVEQPLNELVHYCRSQKYGAVTVIQTNLTGPPHKPVFTFECSAKVKGNWYAAKGKDSSKQKAKHAAAAALRKIIHEVEFSRNPETIPTRQKNEQHPNPAPLGPGTRGKLLSGDEMSNLAGIGEHAHLPEPPKPPAFLEPGECRDSEEEESEEENDDPTTPAWMAAGLNEPPSSALSKKKRQAKNQKERKRAGKEWASRQFTYEPDQYDPNSLAKMATPFNESVPEEGIRDPVEEDPAQIRKINELKAENKSAPWPELIEENEKEKPSTSAATDAGMTSTGVLRPPVPLGQGTTGQTGNYRPPHAMGSQPRPPRPLGSFPRPPGSSGLTAPRPLSQPTRLRAPTPMSQNLRPPRPLGPKSMQGSNQLNLLPDRNGTGSSQTMPSRKSPIKKTHTTPLPPPPAPPKLNGERKNAKNTWSGWDNNDSWEPSTEFYVDPQFSNDAYVESKELMPPPKTDTNIIPASKMKKVSYNSAKGLVKPKGWSSVWGCKSHIEAGYEVYYDVDDIKFGFPTYEEKQNSITSAEAIWNDELFDTEKYQDWEDEWAEYDLKKDKTTYFDESFAEKGLMHHQRDPREEGAPWFAPPRIDGNNLRPELRDQLEKLDREALWKADEKGGKGATYDLPNFARIQSCVDDWIKQSFGVTGTQFIYEFYSSNGLLNGYYCALCCYDWPPTVHQDCIRDHLTSHGHKLGYLRRQYMKEYIALTNWPHYATDALRDYDLEEALEEKITMIANKEAASFKKVAVNVRTMHHRGLITSQAEKLRDGFFKKTKTNRTAKKLTEWSLDEWQCSRYPCDSVNQSTRLNCLNCGEPAPADPYFFYIIKADEDDARQKERMERRKTKYAIRDRRKEFLERIRQGEELAKGPTLPKYINAMSQVPVMTDDEMQFFQVQDFMKSIEESHPGLDLDKDQPLPMEDALEERIKENAYKNADTVACQDGYESGEIQESSDSDEEKEQEEEIPEEPKSPKGDGSKTRKRYRRAVQAERRKALMYERPEIRQQLESEAWIPKKLSSGWWLKDGCWLCKVCCHKNPGSYKFCFGCDIAAPKNIDGNMNKQLIHPSVFHENDWRHTQQLKKWIESNPEADAEKPKDVKGLPIYMQREHAKEQGLFGGDFFKHGAVRQDLVEYRALRVKTAEQTRKIMSQQGFAESPDYLSTLGANSLDTSVGKGCKERIIRAMQRRAEKQLAGEKVTGYLNRFRKNFSQCGWWCESCDYYSFFPRDKCHECNTPRPLPSEIWKYAYKRSERAEAVMNIEKHLKNTEDEGVNYFVGKGKYAQTAAPDWLDASEGNPHGFKRTHNECGGRTKYYMNRQDDLATESQKIAAYNMMIYMTNETMGGQGAVPQGLPITEHAHPNATDESVMEEVQAEMDAEDSGQPVPQFNPPRNPGDDEDDWINKLTATPLLDSNNQLLSFDDKLLVYKKMFEELEQLREEAKQLEDQASSSESEDEDAKRIAEAKKKAKEDAFRSQMAYLHHEDFLYQLGQEVNDREDRIRNRNATYDDVKAEPVDEDFVPARLKNRFAEEFDNLVPDECFDLTGKTDSEGSGSSGSDSDSGDSDYYNPRRKRTERGKYRIPHRRDEYTVSDEERDIRARKKKYADKPPPGIPQSQWVGKSDLQKLKEKYRERTIDEASSRRAESFADSSKVTFVDGVERIEVPSFTIAGMSEKEIMDMNEELYKMSDRAPDTFSGRSQRKRDGLYFDEMGRRRYLHKESDRYRSPSPDWRARRDDRYRRDDRDRRSPPREARRSPPRRRRRSSGSPEFTRNEYDKKRYKNVSGFYPDGTPRWGPDHPDFDMEKDKIPYWYCVKHGIKAKEHKGWRSTEQNNTTDLMPIESWGFDRRRMRQDVDKLYEGKKEAHGWGTKGADYEARRERDMEKRERPVSPERRRRRQSYENRVRYSDEEDSQERVFEAGNDRLRDAIGRRHGRDSSPQRRRKYSDEHDDRSSRRRRYSSSPEDRSHRRRRNSDSPEDRSSRRRRDERRRPEDVDGRDENMVDDIVDILHSRRYGKESEKIRDIPEDERDARKRKREERWEKKRKKEEKKEKKRKKKEKLEQLEENLKEKVLKKIDEKISSLTKKSKGSDSGTERKSSSDDNEEDDKREKPQEISSDSEVSDNEHVGRNKPHEISSESEPHTDQEFFDLPSPTEEGEVVPSKEEFEEYGKENFSKMEREFSLKEKIRRRLIERESFLPFGSVRFDTKGAPVEYQTDIHKMFDELKEKLEREKNNPEPEQSVAERVKSKTFFDSITNAQEPIMTDIETDNEYETAAEQSDYEEDELEIEISTTLRPSFDVLNPAELAAAQKNTEKIVRRVTSPTEQKPVSLTIKPTKPAKQITQTVDLDSETEFDPAPPETSAFGDAPPKPVSPPRSRKSRQEPKSSSQESKPVEGRTPSWAAPTEEKDEPRPVPPPSIIKKDDLMPDRRRTRQKSSPEPREDLMPDRRKTRKKSSPEPRATRSSARNKNSAESSRPSGRSPTTSMPNKSNSKHRDKIEDSHEKKSKASKRRKSPSPVKARPHSPRKTRGQRAAEAKDAKSNMENFENMPTLWVSPERNRDDKSQPSTSKSRRSRSKTPKRRSAERKSTKKSRSRSKTPKPSPKAAPNKRSSKRKRDSSSEDKKKDRSRKDSIDAFDDIKPKSDVTTNDLKARLLKRMRERKEGKDSRSPSPSPKKIFAASSSGGFGKLKDSSPKPEETKKPETSLDRLKRRLQARKRREENPDADGNDSDLESIAPSETSILAVEKGLKKLIEK